MNGYGFTSEYQLCFGVQSLTEPTYSHVFVPNAIRVGNIGIESLRRFGWTPDLHFAYDWDENNDGRFGGHGIIYRFGVRQKQDFRFELPGLESVMTPDQRKMILQALTEKKQVWFTMYKAIKNPLNERILGPDREKILGRGLVKSFGEHVRIDYGVEYLQVSAGDVATDFRVRNGESLRDLWTTLQPSDPAR